MKSAQSLVNLQQIPGDTDIDDRPRSEEDRVREKDKQTPPEIQPTNSIDDSLYKKDPKSTNQIPLQARRTMSGMSIYDRRIF